MVDTKKIKSNLGSRDSIGLKREDVLELIAVHEEAVKSFELDYIELQHRGQDTMSWSWPDFTPKH